jgi:hypothetical protein
MAKKNKRALIAGGAAVVALGGLTVAGVGWRKAQSATEATRLLGPGEGFDEIQYDESIGAGTVRHGPIDLN